VAEGELARNPCVIPGAGQERSLERPAASLAQVYQLAGQVPPRWKALILLAAFCGLRFGELAALTRRDIDPLHWTVTVRASASDLRGGVRQVGPPKSAAGRRTIAIPEVIAPVLVAHLETFVTHQPDSALFVGPSGGLLRSANFGKNVWRPALAEVGMSGFHFHDLRHTGNTMAAATGASLAELMSRMGHASPEAAMRYLHASAEGDRAIATGLSQLVLAIAAGEDLDCPAQAQQLLLHVCRAWTRLGR
jgi:integrase